MLARRTTSRQRASSVRTSSVQLRGRPARDGHALLDELAMEGFRADGLVGRGVQPVDRLPWCARRRVKTGPAFRGVAGHTGLGNGGKPGRRPNARPWLRRWPEPPARTSRPPPSPRWRRACRPDRRAGRSEPARCRGRARGSARHRPDVRRVRRPGGRRSHCRGGIGHGPRILPAAAPGRQRCRTAWTRSPAARWASGRSVSPARRRRCPA